MEQESKSWIILLGIFLVVVIIAGGLIFLGIKNAWFKIEKTEKEPEKIRVLIKLKDRITNNTIEENYIIKSFTSDFTQRGKTYQESWAENNIKTNETLMVYSCFDSNKHYPKRTMINTFNKNEQIEYVIYCNPTENPVISVNGCFEKRGISNINIEINVSYLESPMFCYDWTLDILEFNVEERSEICQINYTRCLYFKMVENQKVCMKELPENYYTCGDNFDKDFEEISLYECEDVTKFDNRTCKMLKNKSPPDRLKGFPISCQNFPTIKNTENIIARTNAFNILDSGKITIYILDKVASEQEVNANFLEGKDGKDIGLLDIKYEIKPQEYLC